MILIRTQHSAWRLTAPMHKLLLTVHIIASVGWLGVTAAKLGLGLAAGRALDTGASQAMLVAIGIVDRMFPPAAILTLMSGIVLGLVTKWGIVQYTWVLVKLVLTIAVPVTAVRIGTRLLADAQSGATPTLLVWLAIIHIVMLAAATVLSVYKPWGLSWIGRRRSLAANQPHARSADATQIARPLPTGEGAGR